MTARVAGFTLSALALVAIPKAQDLATPVFRAEAEAVRVDVVVRSGGRAVNGLAANDFELRDQGVVQRVADISFERLPIDVTIALDISGSISGPVMTALKNGVNDVRKRLRTGDRLKLMTFNMRVQRLVDFSEGNVDTNAVFAEIQPSGSTALLDALAVALASKAPIDRRQLILVFSDGQETSSVSDMKTLFEIARRTTPTLSFVMPMTLRAAGGSSAVVSGGSVVTTGGRAILAPAAVMGPYRQLALETGGTLLAVENTDLSSSFGRVLDEFRAAYVLHFVPDGVPATGFHELQVRVTRRGNFQVAARRGYSAN